MYIVQNVQAMLVWKFGRYEVKFGY